MNDGLTLLYLMVLFGELHIPSKWMNMLEGWDGILRLHRLRRSLDAVAAGDRRGSGMKQMEM